MNNINEFGQACGAARKPRRINGRVLSAALLASSLAVLALAQWGVLGENGFVAGLVMLLCAVLDVFLELLRPYKLLSVCLAVLLLLAGGMGLLLPAGEDIVLSELLTQLSAFTREGSLPELKYLVPLAVVGCILLCVVINEANRRFSLRIVIAVGIVVCLAALIWIKMKMLSLPLYGLLTYTMLVLCQLCAPKREGEDSRGGWHLLPCLLVALLAVAIPHPESRIPWENLFTLPESQRTGSARLAELLDIDQLPPEQRRGGITGLSADQSSSGGWVELSSRSKLLISFTDLETSRQTEFLVGGLYDEYTGKGWLSNLEGEGFGYGEPAEVSESDVFIDIRALDKAESTIVYPSGAKRVVPEGEGTLKRVGGMLAVSESDLERYRIYYTPETPFCELTQAERASCLALPASLPESVRSLSRSLTASQTSDREKAERLLEYLQGMRYTRQVKNLSGSDFVESFVFKEKEGYCVYFASAMAVMARCAGIPARYVIGYKLSNMGAVSVITSSRAHAWAELYIEGEGWVSYDATAAATVPVTATTETEASRGVSKGTLKLLGIITAGELLLILIVFISRPFVIRMLRRISIRRRYAGRSCKRVVLKCERLLNILAACGLRREQYETLIDEAERVAGCDWVRSREKQDLDALMRYADRARYRESKPERAPASFRGVGARIRRTYISRFGLISYLRQWWFCRL